MRQAWFKEGLVFLGTLAIFSFLFFDEEPLFDASDWNGLHVLFLALSAMAVIWENVTRARYGQFVYKDQVLMFATFSFWFFLENYFRFIVIIFCFHSLMPLEADLIELVEVYQCLLRWATVVVLPSLFLLSFTLGLGLLLNLAVGWARLELLYLLTFTLLFSLGVNLFITGWDLALAGLTSANWFCDALPFYLQPKTGITYDAFLNVQDQFDWHRDRVVPHTMHFEDLFVFFLQIFNVMSLTFCLIVWLSLAFDLIQLGSFGVSFTYLAVGLRWLEHTSWNFVTGHFALLLVGLRISLRTPLEFWILS